MATLLQRCTGRWHQGRKHSSCGMPDAFNTKQSCQAAHQGHGGEVPPELSPDNASAAMCPCDLQSKRNIVSEMAMKGNSLDGTLSWDASSDYSADDPTCCLQAM